jgi:hypothetical protein
MTKVQRARERVRSARAWRSEAWAEYAKAEAAVTAAEEWLADVAEELVAA